MYVVEIDTTISQKMAKKLVSLVPTCYHMLFLQHLTREIEFEE